MLDVPLQSDGGYFTAKTWTTEPQTAVSVPANAYVFYWLRQDLDQATQLQIEIESSADPQNDVQLTNQPFAEGLYLVPFNNPGAEASVTVRFAITGGANHEFEWAIGVLR